MKSEDTHGEPVKQVVYEVPQILLRLDITAGLMPPTPVSG